MTLRRRDTLGLAAALATMAGGLRAQGGWPNKPIRLVVPFPPGGGTDITSRLVADRLAADLGWTMVVENKPGAGGNIGLDAVAKAAPDGSTIGMGQTSNLAINPALYPKMPFDPLKDLTPIAGVTAQPIVLVVRADSPLRTLADVVKAAKAKPDQMASAHAGNGTVGHLAAEMLARRAGLQLAQVPYKGAAPAMNDLLGGQVPLYFGSAPSVMTQLQNGKVHGIAVTSAQRLPALASVPTVAEQGYPGFDAVTWLGLVGPAGMAKEAVARLQSEVGKLLARADVRERMAGDGSVPMPLDTAAFGAYVRSEHAKWSAVVRESGAKLD
ncbi:MAG: tripartite tricarboxylate transporter substrate binding protein [Rubrivivax sp.]